MKQRRIKKPWGEEIIWAETSQYAGKMLHIKKGHRLSLQYHEKKEETILVLDGTLTVINGPIGGPYEKATLCIGESFHVRPGLVHRFWATDSDVVLAEVSTTELEDVVRLEDDYKR